MISEKHIQRINKVIKDMVFEFEGNIFTPDMNIKFEYQFEITGQRKMISVGEYYDYLDVLVEIIDADDHYIKLLAVFTLLNNDVGRDYILKSRLDNSIGGELSYFFNESYVRVQIVGVQIGEELQEKIDDILSETLNGNITEGTMSDIVGFLKNLFSGGKEKTNKFFNLFGDKQKNKFKNTDIESLPENIVIGDSQAPYVANGSNKFDLISTIGSEGSLWLGGKTLSWLLESVKKHSGSDKVKNIAICIGTNGMFNPNDNISGLVSEIEKKFPNAELFVIQGSWGWGGLKNVKEKKVRDYYKLFSNYGVEIIEPPIGNIEPHGNKPVYKVIGKNLDNSI
jgi:hypothetical protein